MLDHAALNNYTLRMPKNVISLVQPREDIAHGTQDCLIARINEQQHNYLNRPQTGC
jgi:hypothetical protein